MIPEIKICGLTRPEEAEMLNKVGADYAGFVFFKKSKRYIPVKQAVKVKNTLASSIKTVAVCVNPEEPLLEEIEAAGFDILQVHGALKQEILDKSRLPIWRACNQEAIEDLKQIEVHEKIIGYVMDAKNAGSGRTFDWEKSRTALQRERNGCFQGKKFILAGGLNPENTVEGIHVFSPDVVDVSSGVEGANGKEDRLIQLFAERVKNNEKTG